MSELRVRPCAEARRLSEAISRWRGAAQRLGFATSAAIIALLLLQVSGPVRRMPTAAAAGGCALSRPSLTPDGEEADLLRRLNDYRGRNGLSPLTLSSTLMAAAAWKSADLGANSYFAHDDLGRSWLQRLRDCGYAATVNVAENLAAGNADGASTFQQWQSSSGHNANMLNPAMRAVGVARAYSAGSPFGWYWTAEFGAVVDGAAAAPPSVPPAPAAPTPHLVATADGNVPAAGLAPGATATVSGTGDCLRVHDSPTVNGSVVGCLPDGTAMVIAAGPVAADGYTWWKLGALGWVAGQYLSMGQ